VVDTPQSRYGAASAADLKPLHVSRVAPRGVANFEKVDAGIGDLEVSSNRRPLLSGWTVVVLSAAALALGGCGRKGGLDLPPNASTPTAANANAAAPVDSQAEAASKPSLFNPGYGMDAAPTAAKGRKKPFILDPLLDDRDASH
jgi:predicted small lipoprotein YifL